MTWLQAIAYAEWRSKVERRKIYVRGYRRTVTHIGEWLYGTYTEPQPPINRVWS